MTKESKELLLKDLCARLPYMVKCKPDVKSSIIAYSTLESINRNNKGGFFANTKDRDVDGNELASTVCDIEYIVPYLRPLSSMTEEEANKYHMINTGSIRGDMVAKIDFYLSHHIDFRGLIELDLALKAPDGMYNIKKVECL